MRVAIITMNSLENLGNRLQNYAVQELLRDKGCEVSTIVYANEDAEADKVSKLKNTLYNILLYLGVITSTFYIEKIKKNHKMLLVKQFDKQYVERTDKYFFKRHKMKKYANDFDYYCAGSDQIWNSALVQNDDFFFMKFADSAKTFSVAASMGTTYIDPKYMENYKNGFAHVGKISVREDDVRELIGQMVNRETTVLLDPTLLIDKERWNQISCPPQIEMPKRYLATYFLSEITKSQKDYIERYAKQNGLEIIDLNGSYSNVVGPSEFVYLISNAEFVFTDSFHGTAFSIIFDKKFVVFQRNNMYNMSSRIITILNKFRMPERFYNVDNNQIDDTLFELIDKIQGHNTAHVCTIIEEEKNRANDFLADCLNV